MRWSLRGAICLARYFPLWLLCFPLGGWALESTSLQLPGPAQFRYAGFYAAQALNYYRDAGLAVSLLPAQPNTDPTAEVIRNQADFGIGNSQLIVRRARGQAVVALAALQQHSPTAILLRQEQATDNLHSLSGRQLQLTPDCDELRAYLKAEYVTPRKLHTAFLPNPLEALKTSQMHAVSASLTTANYDLQQARVPHIALTPRSSGLDFYGDVLFTTTHQLEKHPARVQAFLEASLRGWRHALAHPDEIIALIRERHDPEADIERLRYEARRIGELMQSGDGELGTMNPGRWQAIALAYKDIGLMDEVPEMGEFLYKQSSPWQSTHWPVTASLLLTLILAMVASYIYHTNRALRVQIRDIAHLEQSLKDDALRDPLTGLFNRRYLHETLPHEFSRATRQGYPISIAVVDIDHFKAVNDTHGHLAGDEVLKTIALLFSDTLRAGDLASRWGGEEFVLVMPNTSKQVAMERAQVWRQRFESTQTPFGSQHIRATLSAGIATYPDDGNESDDIIQAADLALYLAKNGGRNQVVPFPSSP